MSLSLSQYYVVVSHCLLWPSPNPITCVLHSCHLKIANQSFRCASLALEWISRIILWAVSTFFPGHYFHGHYYRRPSPFSFSPDLNASFPPEDYFHLHLDYSLFLPHEATMLSRSWNRNSVHSSVRLSVSRVLCDETKEHTAEILIPNEMSFW